MGIFNPRKLDASIRDVITMLNDAQKADVLLHALQHLPITGCHMAMENAVQVLLQVPDSPSTNRARALFLRAKGRLAAGFSTSAQQDLHSALGADPENQDVKTAIQEDSSTQSQPSGPGSRGPGGPPRLSEEIWEEIALFLPKRDLRSLLLVSDVLSRIASELLFREIDLHLTTVVEPGEALGYFQPVGGKDNDEHINAWHNQRNVDILTRILVDSYFANQIRSLSIFAVSYRVEPHLGFKIGMLMNALPKLLNLRRVHCSGNKQLISRVLQVVHSQNPRLLRLSLVVTERGVDIEVPAFNHLTHFTIRADGGQDSSVQTFLGLSCTTLRCLSIKNPSWRFATQATSVHCLTQLEFSGCFLEEAFLKIFNDGHQLESLMLSGVLHSPCSSLIEANQTALPSLLHFSLTIIEAPNSDVEFCPAISDFIRERTRLKTYHLFVSQQCAARIGFDASAWAVLPTLLGLRNLSITLPTDLPPTMAGRLIPRTVRALTIDLWHTDNRDLTSMTVCYVSLHLAHPDLSTFACNHGSPAQQLRRGLPPLRYIGIIDARARPAQHIVEQGHPNVRVAWVNGTIWTSTRSEGVPLGVEQWPLRRVKYYAPEWLESLGCEDAIWIGTHGG